MTPVSIDSLLQEANQHLQQKRLADAESAFEQAILADPRCSAAYLGRGLVHMAKGDWGDASDDFDAAERFGLLNEPTLYRSRAMASYFSAFSNEDRLDDANKLIALAPDDPDAWFYRGDALSDLGDYENAIECFTRAIELRPNHGDAYFQRGNAWSNLGETEKATADFLSSTQAGSTDPNIYHRKGHYFEGLGDYEQALKEFRKALELEPNNQRHYNCGGNVLIILEAEGIVSSEEVEQHFINLEHLKTGSDTVMTQDRHYVYNTVQDHFGRVPLEKLELTERSFPTRTMPDIQCAFNELKEHGFEIIELWATTYNNQAVQQFSVLYNLDRRTPVKLSNPRYEEYDIGEDEPLRCLKDGVWLLRSGDCHLLALLDAFSNCYAVRIELAAPRTEQGAIGAERFFKAVEDSIKRSRCYRGKILSMKIEDNYSGTAPGLTVNRIKPLKRDQVILPQKTLDLLDRNVINFVRRREQLSKLGMATKKGLLFYGPPGVGKTHTVHYLATNLPEHTTLLITGEQIGKLGEYMTLARLFAPAIVVVEDVDLIARHREELRGAPEEVMLNKLLNEMDGINPDAPILFILTTNRAGALEEALASRPGRIDQAIEFPLPTPEGRAKLVSLYSHGVTVSEAVVNTIVEQTENVSASFIKELMRRCVQFALDRSETAETIEIADFNSAMEELLVTGGTLNKKLLGVVRATDFGFGRGG